ncbi:MAG: hypothetical protein Q7S25_02860 [Candidatus Limnocylindria bacterium]|nr:hypothetical protein [Candidatus Limnocylindria bacterium]
MSPRRLRTRELIFSAVAVVLLAVYGALGARFLPALLATGALAPTPSKPVEPVAVSLALPGRLAFVLRGDVYVLAGGAYRPATADGRSIQPALSGDGGSLVFARVETLSGKRIVDAQLVPAELGFTRIVRKPTAGGAEELLVEGLHARAQNGIHPVSWYLSPALSPDGKQLALTEDDGNGASDLEVIDLSTPGRRPVTIFSDGQQLADPAWSPDGRTIAVTTYNTDTAGIILWPADRKTEPQRLRKLPEGDAYRPSFSPDGRWLVYTLRRPEGNDVHAFELATGRDIALTTDGRSWNGVLSPDGKWLAYLRADRSTIDLWAMELGGALAPSGGAPKEPKKLTRGEGVDGDSRPAWAN